MLRQILSLILAIVSLTGAALDTGIALTSAEANTSAMTVSASHSDSVPSHAGVFKADHPSQDGFAASDACHDCHIGHCGFILPPKSIVGSAIFLNPHDLARSDILPSDLISYITRPPAAAALV